MSVSARPAVASDPLWLGLAKLSRPKHWIKNVFVLLPVPFAIASGATLDFWAFALGLFGFCLASSAVYAFNDVLDVKRDRLHEKKRHRPVASGAVAVPAAYAWSAALVAAAAAITYASGRPYALLVLGAYVVANLLYCLGAKNVPLVDVFLLSSGFVLRVFLGCALLSVQPSSWLLLCSLSLALYLSFAKRRGDLLKGFDHNHRPALAGYSMDFLNQAMTITAAMTIVGYGLYLMEAIVLKPGREFASLPFVVFGVLEVLRAAHVRGQGDSPVDMLLSSPALLLCGVGWTAATAWSLGLIL